MRTVVITGGTDGIGRGLALRCLRRGDRVVAVGTSAAKGRALLAEAGRLGAGDRCEFVAADLSSVAATTGLVARLAGRHPAVDALVLGAFRYQTSRRETEEGLERTFALYVVSRFLLTEGLTPALERAPRPVVLNLCGTGVRAGAVHWDDLQFRHRYRPLTAVMQGARANDLLGAAYPVAHPAGGVRYVLYNPGFVDTGLAEPFRQPARTVVRILARLFAASVERATAPIAELLDAPPERPLTAFRGRRELDVTGPAFDREAALRLTTTLRELTVGRA